MTRVRVIIVVVVVRGVMVVTLWLRVVKVVLAMVTVG